MAVAREAVSAQDVEDAARLIAGKVRETPVLPAGELSRRVGAPVRAEGREPPADGLVQGARRDQHDRPPARARRCAPGVVAASAGNHAQAVACAARDAGARAVLVMPEERAGLEGRGGAPVRRRGAPARRQLRRRPRRGARGSSRQEGLTAVHAFDDAEVVAGQGTVGLEIARQAPDVKLVVVPLGGGGLASGIGLAVAEWLPGARVVGVQAEACAPYIDSLAAHRPIGARSANTICDGIAVKRPGDFTLPLVERYVDEVVTVSDDEVAEAMVMLLERTKLVVEGAGAVAVAALMQGRVAAPAEGEVCAVLSGGNVDAVAAVRVHPPGRDRRRPADGALHGRARTARARSRACSRVVAEHGGNVVDVEHLRDGIDLHVRRDGDQAGAADARPGGQPGDPRRGPRRGLRACASSARPSPRASAPRPCRRSVSSSISARSSSLSWISGRGRDALDVGRPARARDRDVHARLREHPRHRQLRERVPALLGELPAAARPTSRLRSSASPAKARGRAANRPRRATTGRSGRSAARGRAVRRRARRRRARDTRAARPPRSRG